jgi:hypothetical protein
MISYMPALNLPYGLAASQRYRAFQNRILLVTNPVAGFGEEIEA